MTHLFLYSYDWGVVPLIWGQLLRGLAFTIEIAVISLASSLAMGLLVAVCRMSSFRPLSGLAFIYIQVFRSLSLYIYILWIYFGISIVTGINLSPLQAAVAALTLLNSAYMAEIYRAALKAVDPGQREAALSLGMSRRTAFLNVLLPQGVRIAIPLLVNQLTDIIKDSSIVAIIGASDLMYTTIGAVSYYGRPFEFYTVTGLIYVAVVVIVSQLSSLLETRLRRHVAT